MIELEIGYASQFFHKYNDNRKYFRMLIQDSHNRGFSHLISFDVIYYINF